MFSIKVFWESSPDQFKKNVYWELQFGGKNKVIENSDVRGDKIEDIYS